MDERLRHGSAQKPDVVYAGWVRRRGGTVRACVQPLINSYGAYGNAWWYPTVRPVLRLVAVQNSANTITVTGVARVNAGGRALLYGAITTLFAGLCLIAVALTIGDAMLALPGGMLSVLALIPLGVLLALTGPAALGFDLLSSWLDDVGEAN